jgi:hypothetical protein
MSVLTYNTKEVDRSKNFKPGDVPTVGLHTCKVIECVMETPKGKEPRLKVVYSVVEAGRSKGYRLYDYIQTDASNQKWKLDQFILAIKGPEAAQSGKFDTNKAVGTIVTVRAKHEDYNGLRAKPNGVWFYDESDGEQFEDEEEEPFPDDDVPDDQDAAEDEDEQFDLETTVASADEGDEDAVEAMTAWAVDEGNDLDPDEYETWAEFVEAVEKSKAPKPTKAASKKAAAPPKAATTTKKAAAPAKEEAEEAGEDYSEWGPEDLRAELESRGLKTQGPKSALILRLQSNDADPFDEES